VRVNRTAGFWGTFALICGLWAGSSNAAPTSSGPESPRIGIVSSDGAAPASPRFSRVFEATFEKKQRFVVTWIYYPSTCKSAGVGSLETVEDAVHGKLALSTIQFKIPTGRDCAGTTLPANAAHYTWTDAEENDGEDQFQILYTPPTGSFLPQEDLFGTAKLVAEPELFVVSPTLLVPGLPKRLTLSSVIAADPAREEVAAEALVGDGTATAIVVVRSKAPVAAKLTVDALFGLAPYIASFPSTPPRKASAELVLTKDDFIRRGDHYFAAALLQSPPSQPATYSGFFDPEVAMEQAGVDDVHSVGLAPTPVLLLHGLWGDDSSLVTTRNHLLETDIFRSHWHSLLLGEYPADLSFDSVATITAVRDAIGRLLSTLDEDHVVGGRIDVVAHSMGGLVARAYTTRPDYRAPPNRGVGVFRQVITLDTPHLGSALATYLLDHRSDTAVDGGTLVWSAACGTDPATTVERCFGKNGMSITGGAVESLEPGSAALVKARSLARVPNLRWTAFTAYFTKSVLSLRTVIDGLIRATNPDEKVSTQYILGNVRNDVIVTVPSQRGDASRVVSLVGLAHSKLFSGLQSGPSVLTSPKVDATIECILRDPTDRRCLRGVSPRPEVVAAAPDPERLDIGPSLDLPVGTSLGSPVDITLPVASQRVDRVFVSQKVRGSTRTAVEDEAPFKVEAGRLHVTLLPQLIGNVDVSVGVLRADRTLETHAGNVHVGFVPGSLASFVPDRVDTTLVLFPGSEHPLRAIGRLATDGREVDVTPATRYAVVADPDGSVRLEAGVLHGVRPGRVVVRARVGDLTRDLVVVVKPD